MSTNSSKSPNGRIEGANSGSAVSFQPSDDTLTYERYFGLNEKPFSLNSDPRFVYNSPAYVATSTALLAGIRRREGLLVVTGEIGTGKTTLCRAVLRDLGNNSYSSLVPDPFASREDLLKMLLIDFGVWSIKDFTAGPLRGASRTELSYLLSEFLDSLTPETFVVVVIDEAQNLTLPLIEETRILTDTFGAKGRLQLVFVGQPELHAKLKLPEMRQVDQRVCGYYRLGSLSRDAVAGYIEHRLQAAGGQRDRVLFPPAVVDALHLRSGGVPRLLNRVCDRALHLAHERQADSVDRETLDAALIEIGSTTLLPTWDSIVFAPSPTPPSATPAASTPEPTTVSLAPVVEVPPPIKHELPPAIKHELPPPIKHELPPAIKHELPPPIKHELPPPIVHDSGFKSEIADWVEQDLAPSSRTLSPLKSRDDELESKRRLSRRPTQTRVSTSTVKTGWPRDLRSETYLQRLRRVWGKRIAAAVAGLVALSVAMVGGSLLLARLTAPTLPVPAEAPAPAAPGIAPSETPVPVVDAPAMVSSLQPPPEAGEYLVAVGLFTTSRRADQLVDALTQAGLPAMQRELQLRERLMQQIVLGPYLSRSDAVADLRRLQAIGGYDDARVVPATSSQ